MISEGGVGIAVERIKGGFAAITFNTASETRRVRTSYDGGKTWQPIDAGLPASLSIASIIEVGDYFFVVILPAFLDPQTRVKHGNCYFLR